MMNVCGVMAGARLRGIWVIKRRGLSQFEASLAVGVAHDALLIHGPFAVFLGGALVVVLLALGEGDLALHKVAFPIQFYSHTGVALLIDVGKQFGQLLIVQQKLLDAGGIGNDVGAGGV